MKKTVTLLLPENFDIDAITQKNPFGFYGQGLKKEMAQFIISELLHSRARHHKEMEAQETPFAPLHSKYLKKVVHNYDQYLNFLIKEKILLTDNHFIPGEKCRGYCLNAPYNGSKLIRKEVSGFILKRALRKRAVERKAETKQQMRGYAYLEKWWIAGKLKIDQEAALEWIEKYREQKLQSLAAKKRVQKRAFKIEIIQNTAEDFKQLVCAINEGSRYYGFSGRGHRFYNPISNLPKGLRAFLKYEGKNLLGADVKNSQPFLSLVMLQPWFWKRKVGNKFGKMCLEALDKKMYEEYKRKGIINHIISYHYFTRKSRTS